MLKYSCTHNSDSPLCVLSSLFSTVTFKSKHNSLFLLTCSRAETWVITSVFCVCCSFRCLPLFCVFLFFPLTWRWSPFWTSSCRYHRWWAVLLMLSCLMKNPTLLTRSPHPPSSWLLSGFLRPSLPSSFSSLSDYIPPWWEKGKSP